MNKRRVLFARIGYMHYYSGSQQGDEKPQHGGSHNIQKIGHELYNYKKTKKDLYGYFQPYLPPKGSENPVTINLGRIDSTYENEELIDDVLVIFVSKRKDYGQVIVGWYNNAKVYRKYQPPQENMFRNDYRYNLNAKIKNSVLLPENYRKYKIPTGKGTIGRANVAYLSETNGAKRDLSIPKFKWIGEAIDFIDSYDGPNLLIDITSDVENEIEDIIESSKTKQTGQGFKITPELRKEIEDYSVSKAISYFKKLKYSVENVGATRSYDLHCSKDSDILRVEVKGTQTTGNSIILTPNEVINAKKHKTALYLLHSIKVDIIRKKYKLSRGNAKVVNPWCIDEQGKLKALSYMYTLNLDEEKSRTKKFSGRKKPRR
jgi:hypothetical protein